MIDFETWERETYFGCVNPCDLPDPKGVRLDDIDEDTYFEWIGEFKDSIGIHQLIQFNYLGMTKTLFKSFINKKLEHYN